MASTTMQASDFKEWAHTQHDQQALMRAYQAMESTETREWLRTFDTPNFMSLDPVPPELARLHFTPSDPMTMRRLQAIAKAGWRPGMVDHPDVWIPQTKPAVTEECNQVKSSWQAVCQIAREYGEATAAAAKADSAINAALQASTSEKKVGCLPEDFAEKLFTAMGTPMHSTCPHGQPFYACMPCSH